MQATAGSALGLAIPAVSIAEVGAPVEHESIVFVCLSGGADGLSLVVPYTDPHYYEARPHTAIRPPRRCAGAALDLDGSFGLHPSLDRLKPLYHEGELGLVVGVGFAELNRSHRDAQRNLDAAIVRALDGADPARPGGTLRDQLGRIAQDRGKGGLSFATVVEAPGWDTHAAQGDGSRGYLANHLAELASALLEFRSSMGPRMRRTLVVIVTEFGRSVVETRLCGTDDGHASTMLLLGGHRSWGRVLGRMPSLEPGARSAGRHLTPTSDMGDVLFGLTHGNWP
jgi:uncharacterized protein (DUF1501 family)